MNADDRNLDRRHAGRLVDQRLQNGHNNCPIQVLLYKRNIRYPTEAEPHYPLQEGVDYQQAHLIFDNDAESDHMSLVQQPILHDVASGQVPGELPSSSQSCNAGLQSGSGFNDLGMNIPARGNLQLLSSSENESNSDTGNIPQQESNALLLGNIVYPPSQQNRPEQNVRAECTIDFTPNGERGEARPPGRESRFTSNDGSQYRTSSSASAVYTTAAGAAASQGGGDVGSHSTNMNRFKAAERCRIRYPKFSSLEARFLSFLNIRVKLTQTPQSLTDAGFFFTGYKDTCRCFYCGGDLHSWKPEDDPWQEHARFYPNCGHVKQEKGQAYIDTIQLAVSLTQGKTEVKEIGACKSDFPDAIIRSIEEMGFDREKILIAWKQYEVKVNARKIPRVSDPTNEILDIVQDLPDQKKSSSASPGPRQNSREKAVNRFDYTLCCACKSEKAVVSQKKCGHVVCTGCAPPPSQSAQDEVQNCRYCGREVKETCLLVLF